MSSVPGDILSLPFDILNKIGLAVRISYSITFTS